MDNKYKLDSYKQNPTEFLGIGATSENYPLIGDETKAIKFYRNVFPEGNINDTEIQTVFERTVRILNDLDQSPYFPKYYESNAEQRYCIVET